MNAPSKPRARSAERRSLTNVGGPTDLGGDAEIANVLAHALDVAAPADTEDADDAEPTDHVAKIHAFHAYPARMHPLTARRLVEGLSIAGDYVVDPFAGSGTVIVEAALAGRNAWGTDLNPLAVRLARRKAVAAKPAYLDALAQAAETVAASARERRLARAGASRRFEQVDVDLFAPHVLLALDGLRVGIDAIEHKGVARDLELVLSAILVKLSRRASDTSDKAQEKRIASDFPERLFVRKAEELSRALAEIAPRLLDAPPARLDEDDATVLKKIPENSCDLIVTSPPYPGVYDYLAHHEARLRWLRLKADRFAAREIGASRAARESSVDEAIARWEDELVRVLRSMERVLVRGGRAALLIADSAIERTPIRADALVARAGRAAGLRPTARASQPRAHFHAPTRAAFAEHERREHALVLTK
ncbi:MAG: DNA methyltransferase [Polyangiaceae bacterium]